ncbi:MAG: Ig-like domain-containing protein [Gemmatimonadetes bacterium]|nr:Ig-like domain-containing protein [Gemmatimonadota bacterium]
MEHGAEAYHRDGTRRPEPRITWTSSDPDVATVDAHGTVTAHAPGDVVVTATVEGSSRPVAYEVMPFPARSLEIRGGAERARTGDVVTFQAVGRDGGGGLLEDLPVTWAYTIRARRQHRGAGGRRRAPGREVRGRGARQVYASGPLGGSGGAAHPGGGAAGGGAPGGGPGPGVGRPRPHVGPVGVRGRRRPRLRAHGNVGRGRLGLRVGRHGSHVPLEDRLHPGGRAHRERREGLSRRPLGGALAGGRVGSQERGGDPGPGRPGPSGRGLDVRRRTDGRRAQHVRHRGPPVRPLRGRQVRDPGHGRPAQPALRGRVRPSRLAHPRRVGARRRRLLVGVAERRGGGGRGQRPLGRLAGEPRVRDPRPLPRRAHPRGLPLRAGEHGQGLLVPGRRDPHPRGRRLRGLRRRRALRSRHRPGRRPVALLGLRARHRLHRPGEPAGRCALRGSRGRDPQHVGRGRRPLPGVLRGRAARRGRLGGAHGRPGAAGTRDRRVQAVRPAGLHAQRAQRLGGAAPQGVDLLQRFQLGAVVGEAGARVAAGELSAGTPRRPAPQVG